MSDRSDPRYVITGTIGSGTAWAARTMTLLGSACGHQRVYRVAGMTVNPDQLEGDSSFFAAPVVEPTRTRVLVLVRNPYRVVRSLERTRFADPTRYDDRLTWLYATRHLPLIGDAPDRLGYLLRFVTYWTLTLESDPAVRVTRVEDLSGDPIALAHAYRWLTGRDTDPDTASIVQRRLGTRVNSHGGDRSPISVDDIRAHPDGRPLLERARRFGYPVG